MKIHTTAIALTLATALSAAQEPVKPEQAPPRQDEPEKERVHLPPMPGADPEAGMKQELLELFAKVEGRLRAIDAQMNEAAAGRVPLEPVAGSGIEELLRAGQPAKKPESVGELLESAAKDSEQTQVDIRRMLQIAQQMNKNKKSSSSSSGGKEPSSSPGNSPLDKQGGQTSGREETPKAPGSKPEDDGEPGGNQPKDSPKKDPNDSGENRDGPRPPAQRTGPASSAEGADRWGDLPVRAREIFRVEGASDLPPQYRDWIDGYYRRLQNLERR